MPPPSSTTRTDNIIGPIQQFPWVGAIRESYDPSIDVNWFIREDTQTLLSVPYDGVGKLEKYYMGGMRVVHQNKVDYCAMAMDFNKKDSLEDAYDRAMSIVGKR